MFTIPNHVEVNLTRYDKKVKRVLSPRIKKAQNNLTDKTISDNEYKTVHERMIIKEKIFPTASIECILRK